MDFFSTKTAQRDAAGFAAACRRPGSITDAAIDALVTRRKTLTRVLVIDGRCLCKNNGIGNLFGDYVTWFTVAVLSDRAIYIDWTDSTTPRHSRLGTKHYDVDTCMARRSGNVCNRVGRRFDLGAHFIAMDGTPRMAWQWTAAARARVEAAHGNGSELVLMTRNASEPIACSTLADGLLGAHPWVTIRVSDDTATAMIPMCIGQRKRAGGGLNRRGFPDSVATMRLLEAFQATLVRAGRTAAARVLDEQLLGRARAVSASAAEPRRLGFGQALWNAPLGQVKEWPQTEAALRALRRRKGGAGAGAGAGASSGSVRSAADGLGELPVLGMLTSCVLHAMVRPRPALRAHLTPLLRRVGNRSLVALQLRTGWADDTQEMGLHLAELLAAPPPAVQAALVSATPKSLPARLAAHLYDGFAACKANCRRRPSAQARMPPSQPPLRWAAPLAAHFDGGPAAVAAARWRTLTATQCMRTSGGHSGHAHRHSSRAVAILNECLAPTPRTLHAALQAQLLGQTRLDAPRVLRDFREGVRDPVRLPYANQSKLALTVSCAARVAQAHAHERRLRADAGERDLDDAAGVSDGGGGAPGGASGGADWQLYVSSDSAGLRSLLEQLPELRGHVIGCFPQRCTHPSHRGGSWRTPSEDQTLALATDLWMLGASDATIAASSTTLVYWSARAPPRDGRTQWLSRLPVPSLGNKMLPVCEGSTPSAACPDARPNYDRFCCGADVTGTRCLALRFSLLSEAAAFALQPQDDGAVLLA